MNGQKNFAWRFTLVNRFTLERINEVFTFACDLPHATKKVRGLFPASLYDVEQTMCVDNSSVVIVGYSNLEDLLCIS